MGAQMPTPKPENFRTRLDYLNAMVRVPNASPPVHVTATSLDVDGQTEVVTIFYAWEPELTVLGVFESENEVSLGENEIENIKAALRVRG